MCYRASPRMTHRPLTVAALLLSMFMAALEATVVATAMPTVIGDLGGLALYGWVGAAYLLASTVTVPLYGKLADLRGRKPVLLLGIALFLAGSAACGAAQSLAQLVAFRAVQGLGAGAMQPITLTIIGDLYTPQERGRVQGLFGAVWGVSGVSGPLLGGLIVHLLGWRWVFFINLPLGLLSAAILLWAFHEPPRAHQRASLDVAGTLALTASATLLLAGSSGQRPALAVPAGLGLLALFLVIERRASEPLLPLDLLSRRAMAVSTGASALFGVAMMGTLIYLPLFVQGVRSGTPTQAGAAVAPMLVGWPLAATATSRFLLRVGARTPIVAGAFLVAAASASLGAALAADAPPWSLQALTFFFGVGMGLANTSMIISIQASTPWEQRGVATATNLFARSMGGALGVGALGGVLAARLGAGDAVVREAASMSPEQRAALASSLGLIFWAIAAVAALNAALALLYPRDTTTPASATP